MANTAESARTDGRGRWLMAGWLAAGLILLAPLVAMQFTDEVVWTLGDFVLAGAIVVGAGVTFRKLKNMARGPAFRAAVALAIAGAFSLVWVNAAVGIIGSENNDANFLYLGVLATGLIGALVARFRPEGMARAAMAVAAAQMLVGLIALIGELGTDGATWPWDIAGATGLFTAIWVGSAVLFRKAAEQPEPPDGPATQDGRKSGPEDRGRT